jgi:hypothetical protein
VKPTVPAVSRSKAATRSSSAWVVAPPSVTTAFTPDAAAAWAVRSSAPVAASPANSAARAAMSALFELLIVIAVPLGMLWTLCLAQIAARMPVVT